MEAFFKILTIWVFFALAVIAGTLIGAFMGWFVGLFFSKTILGILAAIGIEGFKMWQIGAFLGFVSGFFREVVSIKTKS